MSDIIREHARLIILRSLYDEMNYSSNDSALRDQLEMFGINKSRDWVKNELTYLEEMGALKRSVHGSAVIVHLQPAGVEHVERRQLIQGVKRMSPLER